MPDSLFRRFQVDSGASSLKDDSGLDFRSDLADAGRQLKESEILAAIERVPSLPTVVTQILQLVGSQQSSASDLEDLVRQDMAIAGKLLKLVNSPFYGLVNEVSSITQAVAIVGFSSLRSLVIAASTSGIMAADMSVYHFEPQGLWKNSIATAALCRAIAHEAEVHKDEAEEYFIAGLLRDIGMLVLAPFLAEHIGALPSASDGNSQILQVERSIIGYDHCWVGAKICDRWSLGSNLRECITRHHRIPRVIEGDELRQLATVRLAERLIYHAGIGVKPGHPFATQVDAVLLSAAGLDAGRFKAIVDRLPEITALADMDL